MLFLILNTSIAVWNRSGSRIHAGGSGICLGSFCYGVFHVYVYLTNLSGPVVFMYKLGKLGSCYMMEIIVDWLHVSFNRDASNSR